MLRRLSLPMLGARVLPGSPWVYWLGAVLTAAGLLLTVWARVHIGRNWSGIVTIKEGHDLITSGPYALVRHPIYTGLSLAFFGSAMACGEWRGVLAVVIVAWSFRVKLKFEERSMRQQFSGRRTGIRSQRAGADSVHGWGVEMSLSSRTKECPWSPLCSKDSARWRRALLRMPDLVAQHVASGLNACVACCEYIRKSERPSRTRLKSIRSCARGPEWPSCLRSRLAWTYVHG